ncbi:MAG: hypothetical protein ABSF83_09695 [Nitrososphaerales archaeon]|jgi:hypothetical protein
MAAPPLTSSDLIPGSWKKYGSMIPETMGVLSALTGVRLAQARTSSGCMLSIELDDVHRVSGVSAGIGIVRYRAHGPKTGLAAAVGPLEEHPVEWRKSPLMKGLLVRFRLDDLFPALGAVARSGEGELIAPFARVSIPLKEDVLLVPFIPGGDPLRPKLERRRLELHGDVEAAAKVEETDDGLACILTTTEGRGGPATETRLSMWRKPLMGGSTAEEGLPLCEELIVARKGRGTGRATWAPRVSKVPPTVWVCHPKSTQDPLELLRRLGARVATPSAASGRSPAGAGQPLDEDFVLADGGALEHELRLATGPRGERVDAVRVTLS